MLRRLAFMAVWMICLGSAGSAAAQAAPPELKPETSAPPTEVVDYSGRLQDESGQAISGVFQLDFALYDDPQGATPVWSERQYVAVVDGDYTVGLGAKKPLRPSSLPEGAWIGVEWVGQGELLRDQFQFSRRAPAGDARTQPRDAQPAPQARPLSQETRQLLEAAKQGRKITFADVAERAVSADSADFALRADHIGDMSAEDVKRSAQLALDRLGAHIADPRAHDVTGGLGLGTDHAVQRRIGGSGGDPYQVNCPPGHVVTGIRGGAGKMVDSISIICTPLQ